VDLKYLKLSKIPISLLYWLLPIGKIHSTTSAPNEGEYLILPIHISLDIRARKESSFCSTNDLPQISKNKSTEFTQMENLKKQEPSTCIIKAEKRGVIFKPHTETLQFTTEKDEIVSESPCSEKRSTKFYKGKFAMRSDVIWKNLIRSIKRFYSETLSPSSKPLYRCNDPEALQVFKNIDEVGITIKNHLTHYSFEKTLFQQSLQR